MKDLRTEWNQYAAIQNKASNACIRSTTAVAIIFDAILTDEQKEKAANALNDSAESLAKELIKAMQSRE